MRAIVRLGLDPETRAPSTTSASPDNPLQPLLPALYAAKGAVGIADPMTLGGFDAATVAALGDRAWPPLDDAALGAMVDDILRRVRAQCAGALEPRRADPAQPEAR